MRFAVRYMHSCAIRGRMSRRALLGVALLMLAPAAPAAENGRAADISTPALVRSADAIVLAACEGGTSSWIDEPHIIVTRYDCRVEQSFKGQTDATLTVQVLGGTVGDVTMDSSASVSVAPDADLVLLLRRSQFGSHYVINGGASGVLPVSSDPQRKIHGMPLADFAHWVRDGAVSP